MKKIINMYLSDRRLTLSDGTENTIKVVSDNDCFYVRLETEEMLPNAVFARITRGGNFYVDVLLDESRMCNIPVNMLEKGDIEIGFYSAGFATTSVRLRVQSSVVRREGIEDILSVPSRTEQLIALVNSIPVVNGAVINDKGELVLDMINSADYNAGSVMGPKGEKGEKGDKGDKGDRGEKGDAYVLADSDKEEIAAASVSVLDNALSELIGTEEEE